MTSRRQQAKGSGRWRRRIAFIALVASLTVSGAGWIGWTFPAQAATTERLVVNRFTGLAINGIDPVAYFTDGRPLMGQPGFELSAAGAVWRFRNEGNRAVFSADPDIYAPQFGGYDPVDVARGVVFAGNPQFWLIVGQRLYLFGREKSRDAFGAAPQRYLPEATRRWPSLIETLAQ